MCPTNGLCPDEYKEINPNKWLEAKCMEKLQINDPVALRDTQEWIRVTDELTEYINQRYVSLITVYDLSSVDFMRENNIVWGVGRGSPSSIICAIFNLCA